MEKGKYRIEGENIYTKVSTSRENADGIASYYKSLGFKDVKVCDDNSPPPPPTSNSAKKTWGKKKNNNLSVGIIVKNPKGYVWRKEKCAMKKRGINNRNKPFPS